MKNARLPKLRHVKFTESKGKIYAYFNLGRAQGARKYAPLPRYGTEDFFAAYTKLLANRTAPDLMSFSEETLAEGIQDARRLAGETDKNEARRIVYFIQCHTGEVKVGVAFNLASRMKSLQAAHPHPIRLLAQTTGGIPIEKAYHERFKPLHVFGEWFSPGPEIMNEVERLNHENKT